MYDTKTRIALVKKRMHEYHRRQERRTVCRLSVLCTLLFLSLVGATGIMQSQPINVTGMYGAILLHEDAGGYVLVAVISFTVAVVITALCIKFRKKGGVSPLGSSLLTMLFCGLKSVQYGFKFPKCIAFTFTGRVYESFDIIKSIKALIDKGITNEWAAHTVVVKLPNSPCLN